MVLFYASEVAACIGLNQYNSINDVLLKMWQRYDNASYLEAIERNKIDVFNIDVELEKRHVDLEILIKKDVKSSRELDSEIKKTIKNYLQSLKTS